MKAIVYTSNTGSTERYAKMLAEKLQIPYYSLKEAKTRLPQQSEIIYLGWVKGGKICGYLTASKKYKISAMCAVGMVKNAVEDIKNYNRVSQKLPLFILEGDFNFKQLRGVHRLEGKLVMAFLKNKAKKGNGMNSDLLQILIGGKQGVNQENLEPLIEFYNKKELDSVTV